MDTAGYGDLLTEGGPRVGGRVLCAGAHSPRAGGAKGRSQAVRLLGDISLCKVLEAASRVCGEGPGAKSREAAVAGGQEVTVSLVSVAPAVRASSPLALVSAEQAAGRRRQVPVRETAGEQHRG